MIHTPFSLTSILSFSQEAFAQFAQKARELDERAFFKQQGEKWSPAAHVIHLTVSTNAARMAYTLPAFLVRIIGGRVHHSSCSYDELVSIYQRLLEAGGKATGRYIPRKSAKEYTQEQVIRRWENASDRYLAALSRFPEERLDRYQAPHPILGKLILRELAFFTAYHALHHCKGLNA